MIRDCLPWVGPAVRPRRQAARAGRRAPSAFPPTMQSVMQPILTAPGPRGDPRLLIGPGAADAVRSSLSAMVGRNDKFSMIEALSRHSAFFSTVTAGEKLLPMGGVPLFVDNEPFSPQQWESLLKGETGEPPFTWLCAASVRFTHMKLDPFDVLRGYWTCRKSGIAAKNLLDAGGEERAPVGAATPRACKRPRDDALPTPRAWVYMRAFAAANLPSECTMSTEARAEHSVRGLSETYTASAKAGGSARQQAEEPWQALHVRAWRAALDPLVEARNARAAEALRPLVDARRGLARMRRLTRDAAACRCGCYEMFGDVLRFAMGSVRKVHMGRRLAEYEGRDEPARVQAPESAGLNAMASLRSHPWADHFAATGTAFVPEALPHFTVHFISRKFQALHLAAAGLIFENLNVERLEAISAHALDLEHGALAAAYAARAPRLSAISLGVFDSLGEIAFSALLLGSLFGGKSIAPSVIDVEIDVYRAASFAPSIITTAAAFMASAASFGRLSVVADALKPVLTDYAPRAGANFRTLLLRCSHVLTVMGEPRLILEAIKVSGCSLERVSVPDCVFYVRAPNSLIADRSLAHAALEAPPRQGRTQAYRAVSLPAPMGLSADTEVVGIATICPARAGDASGLGLLSLDATGECVLIAYCEHLHSRKLFDNEDKWSVNSESWVAHACSARVLGGLHDAFRNVRSLRIGTHLAYLGGRAGGALVDALRCACTDELTCAACARGADLELELLGSMSESRHVAHYAGLGGDPPPRITATLVG